MSINYLDKTGLEHIGEKVHSEKTSINYTTYKDSNITIQDTVESLIQFQGLYGATEQDGTPTPSNPIDIDVVTGRQEIKVDGNNLLNTNDYTLGSWQAGGIPTSTSEVYRFNKPINVVEGETIYLSKHLVLVYDNSSVPQNVSGNLQITIPSGVTKAYFRIFASDTSNFNPSDYMVSRYKIVEYEEYKGRTYEINLGKNLFDKSNILQGSSFESDGTISTNSYTTNFFVQESYIRVDNNSNYVFSSTEQPGRLVICEYDEGKNFIKRNIDLSNTYLNITTTTDTKYIRLCSGIVVLDTLQFEKGNTSTSYSPYKVPIKLYDNECIYRQNSKWYKHKNYRKIELAIADLNDNDNYPGWNNVPYLNGDYPGYNSPAFPTNDLMSNIGGNNTTFGINTNSSNNVIFMNKGAWGLTASQWKEQYPNLIVILYYALPTPIEEEITDTELIAQLEDLYTATYMNGTTYITVSGDLPIILNISYDKPRFLNLIDKNDLENYIKEVESKIDNIVDGDEVSY